MLDLQSFNASLQEVMISSNIEHVFLRDLSGLTLHIIFHAWCFCMNLCLKCGMDWNDSRHVSLLQFYLHCGIVEIGSPGIIRIVCPEVLGHLSEHGPSSIGNLVLGNAHTAKLNRLTALEVTKLTS